MVDPFSTPSADPDSPDAPRPALIWLFHFCAFLTAIVWLDMVIGFIRQSPSNLLPDFSTEVFLLFLGAYGGMKEFKRASGTLPPEATDQRIIRGEFFLVLWGATGVAMGEIAHHGWWGLTQLPHDLRTILWTVSGIFLGTTCSKSLIQKKLPWSKGSALPPPASSTRRQSTPPESSEEGEGTTPSYDSSGDDTDEDAELRHRVVDALGATPKGLTRAELEQALGMDRRGFMPVVRKLLESGIVTRVGNGPSDPNTRYVLFFFLPRPKQGSTPATS